MAEVKNKPIYKTKEDGTPDFQSIDLDVKYDGSAIVLPNDPAGEMPIPEAIKQLKRIDAAQNMEYEVHEVVPVHFYDGLVALASVLKEKYGYAGTTSGTVNTFFGKMKVPPRLIHVKTGPNPTDFIQVPFGGFNFPGVEGTIETKYEHHRGLPCLVIEGTIKMKEKKIVMDIVTAVQEFAKHNSIYRGRAIVLERDEGNGVNFNEPLQFFSTDMGTEIPIFDEEIERLLKVAVEAPIANSERCRREKIPLKRGILLEGPPGTGKSLTAKQVGQIATDNNWTFINVTAATALTYALQFAKMYQPCVVFAEDIDRLTDDRNEGANDLLNKIDGVVGKEAEIMTILTTNYAEKIEQAMLRPGRLDAVISLRAPKADAVERLIRAYAGTFLTADVDISEACTMLAGNIPASIREVVERSKLAAIVDGKTKITPQELKDYATSMQNHLELLANAKSGKKAPSIDDLLTEKVREVVNGAFIKVGYNMT